jgi:hypothetical protein
MFGDRKPSAAMMLPKIFSQEVEAINCKFILHLYNFFLQKLSVSLFMIIITDNLALISQSLNTYGL